MNELRFPNDRALRISVFLLFILLFIGSIYYFQERMLFSDASHIFFSNTNNHNMWLTGVSRYGAFITQMFPFVTSYVHVPIKVALLLYSMSFNLFYLAVAGVILFRYKNTKLGILFGLYFTLFVSDTYFWTNNEIHQAMGWTFLLFAIIQNYKYEKSHPVFHFTIVIILAFLGLFTHPLMLFAFPFLWIFTIIDKDINPYSRKQVVVLTAAFLVIFLMKYYSMHQNDYDANKVKNATKISFLSISNALQNNMAKAFADKLIKDYYLVLILFILGIVGAVQRKKYKQIVLVFLFVIPYFLAICLTYDGFAAFYSESEWMPFTIITSALFVYYFAPSINTKWVTISVLIIFTLRLSYIAIAGKRFEARKDWVYARLKDMKQQGIYKGYIYYNDSLQNLLLLNWGGPTESILASALMGEKPSRTFLVLPKAELDPKLIPDKNVMIAAYELYPFARLNPYYFTIDTTQQYQLINYK